MRRLIRYAQFPCQIRGRGSNRRGSLGMRAAGAGRGECTGRAGAGCLENGACACLGVGGQGYGGCISAKICECGGGGRLGKAGRFEDAEHGPVVMARYNECAEKPNAENPEHPHPRTATPCRSSVSHGPLCTPGSPLTSWIVAESAIKHLLPQEHQPGRRVSRVLSHVEPPQRALDKWCRVWSPKLNTT